MSSSGSATVRMPTGLHLQSRFFAARRKLWHRLGNLETSVLRDELERVEIKKPVYVSGLARSGTTIVLEMLEKHPDLTSHRYSDFPNVWTPYWRNYLLQRTRREQPTAVERAHQDRIQVTNDSPEAVEEVLWMHFFPDCHADTKPNTLDEGISNPEFESFYRDHIRKLLAVRESQRYLAKGNYNLGRFLYILKLFPDARFLIPYRDPLAHIASLAKQHDFFTQANTRDPRVAKQLAFSGHFEFGPQRRAIHFGDGARHRAITAAWADGREVEGWALYWAETYQFLMQQARTHPGFAKASLFLRYEDLCSRPREIVDRLTRHCELEPERFADVQRDYCSRLSLPEYYRPNFTAAETETIQRICGPVFSELNEFQPLNGKTLPGQRSNRAIIA